jgi:hypothetical protein
MLSTAVLRCARIAIERAELADPAFADWLYPIVVHMALDCHALVLPLDVARLRAGEAA